LHLDKCEFDKATLVLYDFFWNDFCAYYLELAKPVLFGKELNFQIAENKQKLLLVLLMSILRLVHPIAPFITEELFQTIKAKFGPFQIKAGLDRYSQDLLRSLNAEALTVAPYPKAAPKKLRPQFEKAFGTLSEIVRSIRNIRTEMKVPPGEKTDLFLYSPKKKTLKLIEANQPFLRALLKLGQITFCKKDQELPNGSSALWEDLKIVLPLSQELIAKEKERLIKEKAKVETELAVLKARINNPEFLAKAPQPIVKKMQDQFEALQNQKAALEEKISSF
ncbi:MAG: class I tRNA ligase family protein, partial [Parachlamydiales bacterium]